MTIGDNLKKNSSTKCAQMIFRKSHEVSGLSEQTFPRYLIKYRWGSVGPPPNLCRVKAFNVILKVSSIFEILKVSYKKHI